MTIKDGGPAFPVVFWDKDAMKFLNDGMSLRDYFAAKVIQGMVADPNVTNMKLFIEVAPIQAYKVADAMLAERAKEKS